MALSYQEVVIALSNNTLARYKMLSKFARNLGISMAVLCGIVVFSPLVNFWFREVSGLSEELTAFSILPSQIMVILPSLSVWLSLQRSILVTNNKTQIITITTGIEITLISVVLYVFVGQLNVVGAISASCAYMIGRLTANCFLFFYQNKHGKSLGIK